MSAAQAHNWHVADFKDTISIAADGTALVSENITVLSSSANGTASTAPFPSNIPDRRYQLHTFPQSHKRDGRKLATS